EKQPTGRGPEGCDENGPAAVRRPPDRLRIALDMRPPTASPARTVRPRPDRRPILIATKDMLISGQDTNERFWILAHEVRFELLQDLPSRKILLHGELLARQGLLRPI